MGNIDASKVLQRTGPLDTIDLLALGDLSAPTWRENLISWLRRVLGPENRLPLTLIAYFEQVATYWGVRIRFGVTKSGLTIREWAALLALLGSAAAEFAGGEGAGLWFFVAVALFGWVSINKRHWRKRTERVLAHAGHRDPTIMTDGAETMFRQTGFYATAKDRKNWSSPEAADPRSAADPEFLGMYIIHELCNKCRFGMSDDDLEACADAVPDIARDAFGGWRYAYLVWQYRFDLANVHGQDFASHAWRHCLEMLDKGAEADTDLVGFGAQLAGFMDILDKGDTLFQESTPAEIEVLEFTREMFQAGLLLREEGIGLEDEVANMELMREVGSALAYAREKTAVYMDGIIALAGMRDRDGCDSGH